MFANWKCLIQEKEEAIQTTSTKLQNMQPNKLSENRLRQEIEQWIDFKKADRHVMKRCMHNLQTSMKDKLHYLRKQKHFLLDKQKTLKNVYKTIEKSNRSRIPNPFLQFILDVKREHYQLFNEELLVSSNGSLKYEVKSSSTPVKLPLLLPNKKMKYVEDSNSESLKRQPLLPNKNILYAKERSDTTLKLPALLPDKEKTCMQEHPFTYRPGTPKLHPPLQILPQNIKKTLIVNKIRDENKDKSKVNMSTESTSKPATQQLAATNSSNENLDMSAEISSKRVNWKSKYRTLRLQNASRKNNYSSDRKYRFSRLHLSSGKKCYIPKSKSDKVSKMVDKRYCTTRKQNMNIGNQTDREKTDRYPKPDQIHALPRNMKERYIINKISNEKKEKSRAIPTQSKSITANGGTLNMNSEFALRRVKWENKFPTFKLQKASGKDYHISERKYRFSRLHKSSGKNCYIPKSKSDKVSKIVTKKYCTTRTQKRNVKKQTEMERPDRYPAPDQIHNWQDNLKNILILKKMKNEKKCESEVVKSMFLSVTKQADETNTSNKSKPTPEQTGKTTAFNKMYKSTQQEVDETKASNKMSKPAQQQADETKAANKISKSAQEHTDETKASHKMSKSAPEQTDETTAFHKISKSTQQQADRTTTSNQMSEPAQQQTDETKASNKMSKSTQQQADETTDSNEISDPAQNQTNMTTAFNKMSKPGPEQTTATQQRADRTTASNDTTRKQNRNVREQTEREKSVSNLEQDIYHTMMKIAVDDKYPTEDIFHKLGDNELIGFYQVQENDLFPVIENMSDSKVIEIFKKLHDQHIAVIQSRSNTVVDTQSSSSGSTIDDFQDAGENGGTLKSTMKTFVKKLIPGCITNGNQCQPTETLSSDWQIIKILSGTNIKTQFIPMPSAQFIPMPPNSPKPKTSNVRRKRYGR